MAMNISNELLQKAVQNGLCEQHTQAWDRNWSIPELVSYYKANPDWCLERRFPSLDFMKKHFKSDMVRNMGVYIDTSEAIVANGPCYVFNNCRIGAIVSNITRFYLGLETNAKIIVKDGGDLVVDTYDDSRIEVELRGSARCIVYQRGRYAPIITGSKNYKIRDKRK